MNRKSYLLIALIGFSLLASVALHWHNQGDEKVSASDDGLLLLNAEGSADNPHIAFTENGKGVIVWQQKNKRDYDIYAQRIDATGEKKDEPILVNQYTKGQQQVPRVAADAAGNFVVVWQSVGQDSSGSGVYGQRFSKNGAKVGGEFQVNSHIKNNQSQPAVAMRANGEFVVVWVSEKQDGTPKSIYAQIYEKNGKRKGDQIEVLADPSGIQTAPDVAIDTRGNIFIVWQSSRRAWDIYAQVLDWNGNRKLSEDALVNAEQDKDQSFPRVTVDEDGLFTVVYMNDYQHPILEVDTQNIVAQNMNAAGARVGESMNLSEGNLKRQDLPVVSSKHSFRAAAWRTENKEGQLIVAQKFNSTPALQGELLSISTNEIDTYERVGHLAIAESTDSSYHMVWTRKNLDTKKKEVVYKAF